MSTIKAGKIQPPNDSDSLQIFTNTVERMRVTSGGLVGIGTASPSAPLHVSGLAAEIRITTPGIVGADFAIFPQTLPGSLGTPLFRIFDRYNYLDRLTISSDGLVGIGTSSPTAKLHIVGGQAEAFRLTAGTTGDVGLRVYEDADTDGFLRFRPISSTQKGFVFSNYGDTGILNINTLSSRVGIGTTTPTVALDVAGSIKASTSLILGDVNATMAVPNGSAPIFGARAWAYIPSSTVSGTQPASSGNIASITRVSANITKVTFISPMPHANYAVVGLSRYLPTFANQPQIFISPAYLSNIAIQPNTTTEMYFTVWDNNANDGQALGYNNISETSFVIYC